MGNSHLPLLFSFIKSVNNIQVSLFLILETGRKREKGKREKKQETEGNRGEAPKNEYFFPSSCKHKQKKRELAIILNISNVTEECVIGVKDEALVLVSGMKEEHVGSYLVEELVERAVAHKLSDDAEELGLIADAEYLDDEVEPGFVQHLGFLQQGVPFSVTHRC